MLSLLSSRFDPLPRAAILELCAGGAALAVLSGMRSRAVRPRGWRKLLHAALALAALAGAAYVALYRGNLVGMLVETFRAGPD